MIPSPTLFTKYERGRVGHPTTGSRISPMKPIPWRVQLGVVAVGYVAVILVAAVLVYVRYMQYVNHPDDVMSSGSMYAFGDWMLELFIGGLFLIPTFLLVLVIRKSETAYTSYSQTLLGLSLTAPICLGVFLIPAVNQGTTFLGWFCCVSAVCLATRRCGPGGQSVVCAI